MDANEKFIRRLEEEGLYEKWVQSGDFAGKVMDDGTIVLFSHYYWNSGDKYLEEHYPSFEDLRKDDRFRLNCMNEFFDNDDNDFVASLARWLYGYENKCPLYCEDLYFAASGLETKVIEFKDNEDSDAEMVAEMVKYLGEKTGREFHGNINGIEF